MVNDSSRLNEFGREVVGFDLEIQLGFRPFAVNTPANMNSLTNLTPRQLRQAADIQEKIQDLQNQLQNILGAETLSPIETTGTRKNRRKVSAAGRRRMRAAQLARWAKIKGGTISRNPLKA